MSEVGEIFNAFKMASKSKRTDNYKKSLELLKANNVEFKVMSEESRHIRIGDFDFWPSTGLFMNRKTGEKRRGVFALLKTIKNKN